MGYYFDFNNSCNNFNSSLIHQLITNTIGVIMISNETIVASDKAFSIYNKSKWHEKAIEWYNKSR